MRFLVFAAFFLLAGCGAESSASLVQDDAHIFSEEEEKSLALYHERLLRDFGIDYRVVTTSADEDINMFASRYFNSNNVGSLGGKGRGLLLVVNTKQNLVRLEVASVLEPVYTDAFVSYIEHRQMIPFFRAGQVRNGILAATELIFDRVIQGVQGRQFDETALTGSRGGGAVNQAGLGAGIDKHSGKAIQTKSGLSPEQVLAAYLQAMRDRNSNPELPIYSRNTIAMKKNWVVTPAQMDMEARTLSSCRINGIRISGDMAVVRHEIRPRTCAPYFFIKEDGEWKIDFAAMMKTMRFNHLNEWHFDMKAPNPYGFAFQDWRFDGNGYPYDRE